MNAAGISPGTSWPRPPSSWRRSRDGSGDQAQPDQRAQADRPVALARQHPPPADHLRRARPPARRGPDRRHIQPDHLREGRQRFDRLRRGDGPPGPGEGETLGHAVGHDGRGHPGRGGCFPSRLRQDERPGRIRQHRGLADARERHPRHDRHGRGPAQPLPAPERHGQDPRDEGRHSSHPGPDLQGPQHQHHVDLRRRPLRRGRRGVPVGAREAAAEGW